MTDAPPPTPSELAPRRRRVWPWVLAGVGVLLVGAGFAADALARGLAERAIAEQVASALDVPRGTEVQASIGGGPVLVQALTGRLDRVDVEVPRLVLGPLTGRRDIVAEGVPLDMNGPTRELKVRYSAPEDALAALVPEIPGVAIDDVGIDGPEVVVTGSISVLGTPLALGVGLTPSAVDGDLALDPTSIRIGDQTFTADEARQPSLFRGLVDALLQQRRVCIADALPAALTLTELSVEGTHLVATFDGSGVALGGESFQQKGVCAA